MDMHRYAWCAALVTCLIAASCRPFSIPDNHPTFPGLADPPSGDHHQSIRVYFTHGIGIHDPTDPDVLLSYLIRKFDLVQKPVGGPKIAGQAFARPEPVYIRVPGSPRDAELYFYDFVFAPNSGEANAPTLTFVFLLWSPLTTPIKDVLRTEEAEAHPEMAPFNGWLRGVLNDRLSDAILYSGKYRTVLQPTVIASLCAFMSKDRPAPRKILDASFEVCSPDTNSSAPVRIITHSLGSAMVYDALARMHSDSGHPQAKNLAATAEVIAACSDRFYMLANQLSLLSMANYEGVDRNRLSINEFLATRQKISGAGHVGVLGANPCANNAALSANRTTGHMEIVAVSDPNDDLSYALTAREIDPLLSSYTNLFVWTTSDFGIFANPGAAHGNYFTNPVVNEILACGMTGGRVNSC